MVEVRDNRISILELRGVLDNCLFMLRELERCKLGIFSDSGEASDAFKKIPFEKLDVINLHLTLDMVSSVRELLKSINDELDSGLINKIEIQNHANQIVERATAIVNAHE